MPTEARTGAGRVVAVWGPTGAPGRTGLAVNLAAELADLAVSTLLVDADVYGGAVAQVLGLLDEAPGLAAAARQANYGSLDAATLSALTVEAAPKLAVLTGILRAERWPELRPAALDVVTALARDHSQLTVVDCGFAVERDDELGVDAPRRNAATLALLGLADVLVVVGAADPVGLQRLVRGLTDLRELQLPAWPPTVVVNKVRAGVIGGVDAPAQIRAALDRYAGVHDPWLVPLDVAAFDVAMAAGQSLREAAPSSAARLAIRGLAAHLAGLPPEPDGGRRQRWRLQRLRPQRWLPQRRQL
jgi:MinD-like ATPase involved in chromosome partitioning or flagellar assembly